VRGLKGQRGGKSAVEKKTGGGNKSRGYKSRAKKSQGGAASGKKRVNCQG